MHIDIYQTAHVMLALEAQFRLERPDLVIVFGDVNSTVAAAIVAAQRRIPLAHVEAGLRSYDREMPEENNRVLTDAMSDLLFITDWDAEQNLRNEGIAPEKIHFVGNTMIDSLVKHRSAARNLRVPDSRTACAALRGRHAAPPLQRGRARPVTLDRRRASEPRGSFATSCSPRTRAPFSNSTSTGCGARPIARDGCGSSSRLATSSSSA